jgi:hypothetical protein
VNEREITEDQVRDEHIKGVNPTVHWIYLLGVILGALVLMVVLIALLGG